MLFQRFLDDRSASVVPLLALAAIPITGLIGASIDYSRAAAVRTSLQAAADSTVLAMSKTVTPANVQNVQLTAGDYLGALFKPSGADAPNVTLSFSQTNGSHLVLTATSSVPTMFMRIMGFSDLQISATSTATWGNTRLRVALVLDNTGSMTDGTPTSKIDALKVATHGLLSQLQSAAVKPEDVYVSIIPFTKDVNVDPSNYNQSWIDWTDWDQQNGKCSKSSNTTQSSCTHNSGTWTPSNHSTWNGCVTDRTQNSDTTNATPTAGGTLFPAEQYSVCPTPIVAQTNVWQTLNDKVDAMVAAGNTNQAIGLAWGWQSLTSGTPLSAPAKDPNFKYQDIVILLSDGLNTQDRWYSSASSIDNRQRTLCDNIKSAGVTIYAVQVNTGKDATSSVLQYCAGTKPQVADASKFFLLKSSGQIVTTFNQIGVGLSKLRIAN